jgi:uncharacterized protein (TIGR00369 family)
VSDVESGTSQGCYVCGTENVAGLQIPFRRHPGGGSRADYVSRPEHAGWPGVIHGGFLFTLMDEAVSWACRFAGSRCVTAKAEARFRAPARVGMALVVTGRVVTTTSRVLRATAEIRNGSETGEVIAEMDAMMAIVRAERLNGEVRHVERE